MVLARPIIQMDLDGNVIAEFPSIRAAAKKVFNGDVSKTTCIQSAATIKSRSPNLTYKLNSEKTNISHGFRWKYKETL